MISKCSTVILNKRKFSEFEDGDLDDRSLYIVGYQDIDGERVNVKINVAELLDKKNGDQVFVVSQLEPNSCQNPEIGPQDGVVYWECAKCFVFDIRKTGTYIQINSIPRAAWQQRDPYNGKPGEYYINIAFKNTVLGNNIKLYLPNLGIDTTYADMDVPCKVYLYQIGPDEMEQISNMEDGEGCKLCDMSAGQKYTAVLTSYPKSVHAIEAGRLKRDYYDYFVRFITLTDLRGVKMTRAVEVTNIYEGDWSEDGSDIG